MTSAQSLLANIARTCALLLISLSLACPGSAPHTGKSSASDLKTIRDRGVLRVLTRNNGTTYYVQRGRQFGFAYEMAEKFAERLGVRLEIVVPKDWGDMLPMLLRGEGDIIAAGYHITEGRKDKVAFTEPYGLNHIRVAWREGAKPIDNAEELSGKSIHVRQSSAYFELLTRLNADFLQVGLKPIDVVLEGGSLETEEILKEVSDGNIPYTLCDVHICREAAFSLPNLHIGPSISEPHLLGWAVHPQADKLLNEVNAFFAEERNSNLPRLFRKYYRRNDQRSVKRKDANRSTKTGTLSPYDAVFQGVASRHRLDWRLMAAQAFEESRFNPKAKGSAAGRGLFGLLPRRARQLGVKDMSDPTQATEAGASNLAAMRERFSQVPDESERLKFALAACQAGAGHVTDARLLASKQGLNPDLFADVARVLPLLSLGKYASEAEHGFLRGSDTVAYVDNIWERYRAYRHALGERDPVQR